MNLLIAIPTKNRVDILEKNALAWAKLVGKTVTIFVEPQDYPQYCKFFDKNIEVVNIGENDKGLGFVKNYIKKFALNNNYDLVFKVDDDAKGFTNYRVTSKSPEESAEIVKKFLVLFEEKVWKHDRIKAVAFPYSFQMFDKFEFQPVKKVQSTYIARTEYLSVDGMEFSTFEDFSVGLNIVVNNGLVMKYGMSGQMVGIPVGKGEGGCQDFNRMKQAEIEAELLRKIYPPLVFKKVDKPWGIEPDMRSIRI